MMLKEIKQRFINFLNAPKNGSVLAKNTLWMTMGLIGRAVLQIVYFVIVARTLKPEEYGSFAGALALVTVFSPFVGWGSGNILVKNVAREKDKFHIYWGMALSVSFFSGLVFCLLSVGVGIFIFSLQMAMKRVFPLAVGVFFGDGIVSLSGQAFQAHQMLSKTSLLNLFLGLFRLCSALLLFFLSISKTADNWVILYMLCGLLSGVIGLVWVRHEFGKTTLGLNLMRGKWREGFYFAIGTSSSGVYNDIDKTLLVRLASDTTAGIYTAAYRIIDAACIPIRALLASTYPNFFKKGEKGIKETSKFAFQLLPFTTSWSILAIIAIIFCSPLIPVLLGEGYSETTRILLWLSPLILFRALHNVAADAVTGSGFQGIRSGIQIFVAILNLGLNIWWIPSYGWLGAVWSSLISDGLLIICLWSLNFVLQKNDTNFKVSQ
jgi:O-antigen/teichoic acid export membrane protein